MNNFNKRSFMLPKNAVIHIKLKNSTMFSNDQRFQKFHSRHIVCITLYILYLLLYVLYDRWKGEFQRKFHFYFIIIKPLYFIFKILKLGKVRAVRKEHVLKSRMYNVRSLLWESTGYTMSGKYKFN